jgi:DNA-binding transcriptional MerR regulator
MDLAQNVFGNADLIAATGVSAAILQTWANRGILPLPENRRNPGTGKKRLYSGLDIFRVAAIQALTRLGVSASVAATITGRIESGQTADAWMQALALASPHVYVFIADGGAVPAIYAGDDETAVAHILRRLHAEPGGGAEKRMAVFDVGPDVCRALQRLYGQPKKQMDAKPSLPGETPAAVPPAPAPPAPSIVSPPVIPRGPWRRLS